MGISVKSAQRHHFHVHGNGGVRRDSRTEIGRPLASSIIAHQGARGVQGYSTLLARSARSSSLGEGNRGQ